jgi:hypothetical protein
LEDERVVLKASDKVEQRMDNKTKRKLQKKLKSWAQRGNAQTMKKVKSNANNKNMATNPPPAIENPFPQWNWQPPPGFPPQMDQAPPPSPQQYWIQHSVTTPNMNYQYPPQRQTHHGHGRGQGRGRRGNGMTEVEEVGVRAPKLRANKPPTSGIQTGTGALP